MIFRLKNYLKKICSYKIITHNKKNRIYLYKKIMTMILDINNKTFIVYIITLNTLKVHFF